MTNYYQHTANNDNLIPTIISKFHFVAQNRKPAKLTSRTGRTNTGDKKTWYILHQKRSAYVMK